MRTLIGAICAKAGGLIPTQASLSSKKQPFSIDAVERLLAATPPDKMRTLFLSRSDPEVHYRLAFLGSRSPIGLSLSIVMPMEHFATSEEPARAAELIALVAEIARVSPPLYGFAQAKGELGLGTEPHVSDPIAPYRVYEAHWLSVYGSEMVERIGRERVLSTPASRIETLPDGGVILITSPNPADFAGDASRIAQARMLAHLRPDVTFEDALNRLRARSAKLAPVDRDWDPDIADLLERTLDFGRFCDRQVETARLNAYRPPAVTECRTGAEMLPFDVDDVKKTIDHYEGLYAERFAALFHKEIPEVMKATPGSLVELDFRLWHLDYPGEFERADLDNDLVPSMGAYLGLVLVRNLGGRWVPRRVLNESQVLVGDRAYLPFLRAWRALRSQQSVLDYSMTKLYRDAERVVFRNS